MNWSDLKSNAGKWTWPTSVKVCISRSKSNVWFNTSRDSFVDTQSDIDFQEFRADCTEKLHFGGREN